MKEYNYLQAIYLSFFSRKLYRDVVNNWGAGVVLYLFIILAISWAAMMFRIQPGINVFFKHMADSYATQVPEIIIKNGQSSTPENRPYFVKDPDNNEIVAIIDTSGKYQNLDNAPKSTSLLVTKDTIYFLNDKNTTKIQKIPASWDMDIKSNVIKEKAGQFSSWFGIILFPVLLIFSFIYRLVQSLLYAIIGEIFGALSNIHLSYVNVLKLTMVALTPAIVLSTVFDWFGIEFRLQLFLYFIISMAYLIFALGANKNKI